MGSVPNSVEGRTALKPAIHSQLCRHHTMVESWKKRTESENRPKLRPACPNALMT